MQNMNPLEETIWTYYMPLYHKDPNIIEYYADIFEELNCLIWKATLTKANMQASNWQACLPLAGWNGFAVTLPGS